MFLELFYGLHYFYFIWFSIACIFTIVILIIPNGLLFIYTSLSYKIYLLFGILSLILFFITMK